MSMPNEFDECYMALALQYAERAQSENEVPVGAVVVAEGKVIGFGWNQPIGGCDPTAHAEIQALRNAAKSVGNYRLPNATLYVTIEPCAMCVGAMMHARIARLVFGAAEPKAGAVNSRIQLPESEHWNHTMQVQGGVLQDQASQLMSAFFKERRDNQKALKKAAKEERES